jgi:serine/threonine protein kinase
LKGCATCQRLYPDDAGFCPSDGTPLKPVSELEVPSDPDDLRIGQSICNARYQVRRKVADGGMGRVYQALDTVADRNVAVKVLHPEVSRDRVSVERFKREYELSSQLPHDHIVEVLDFQRTEDESYALVMEYLEGEELRMFLKREKVISSARCIRLLSQLAIGLEEPHKRKIVHRDLKPDNIFLCHTDDGPVVKLLDFGSVRDNAEGAKKLTVIGTTIGSPFYMSPEQAQGLPELDHRADIWSLAAIAYESLTGVVPFGGATGPQILLAILSKEPDPPSIVGEARGVPKTLDDVIADSLAKEAGTRLGTVAELADRFGEAYGLEGSHREWAYMPEPQLETLVEQRLPAKLAELYTKSQAAAAVLTETPDAFQDESFVMGVPSGPPKALFIGIGVGALVLAVGVVALLLL